MVRGTSAGRGGAITIAIVAFHLVLLAAYTFPDRIVPDRLRILGQAWARPLFHQQWKLFAPDPPLCSCEVQVAWDGGAWRSINADPAHYLTRRMSNGIAHYAQGDRGRPSPVVREAMRRMVRGIGDGGTEPRFRLVERCVADPGDPAHREERITELP